MKDVVPSHEHKFTGNISIGLSAITLISLVICIIVGAAQSKAILLYVYNNYPLLFKVLKYIGQHYSFILLYRWVSLTVFNALVIATGLTYHAKKRTSKHRLKFLYASIACFFLTYIFSYCINNDLPYFFQCFFMFFYVTSIIAFYLLTLIFFSIMKQNDVETEIFKRFKQNGVLNENKYSFNWQTTNGYVNLLNPFRGTIITAGPGGGKSFTLIEPIIDQAFHKGFSALIYDFKFPTIAKYAYNAYVHAKNKGKNNAKFYAIYFKDVRYSNRCNPLHHSIITDISKASEASSTVLLNINKNWQTKAGDFFVDSPISIFTAIIWFLRKKSIQLNRDVCSLPHAIKLCTLNTDRLIEVLASDPEIAINAKSIQEAMEKGALEQLAGQMSSLMVALAKINDKTMDWVMTGNDFSLNLNEPGEEKIVILGNDDEKKKTYAAPLSLYAGMVAGVINQKYKSPCLYCVDEFPTLYIQNFDNLPNTGRSNLIATVIACQSFSQITRDYGEKEGKVIRDGLGNIFIGETADMDTAKFASQLLGGAKFENQNISIGKDTDHSTSISKTYEEYIKPEHITRLNKGEFVGKVSDVPDIKDTNSLSSFLATDKNENVKIFASKFLVDKPSEYNLEFPKLLSYPHLSEEEELKMVDELLNKNSLKVLAETKEILDTEFWINRFKKSLLYAEDENLKLLYHYLEVHNSFTEFLYPYTKDTEHFYQQCMNNNPGNIPKALSMSNEYFKSLLLLEVNSIKQNHI